MTGNWPIMKIALAEMPVFTFRALCLSGGAVGLFAIAVWKRMPLGIPRGHLLHMLWISLFNITGWNVFVLYGLSMLPAGRTTILAFTMPLWLIPMSVLLLHERLTGWKLAGLGIGLTGLNRTDDRSIVSHRQRYPAQGTRIVNQGIHQFKTLALHDLDERLV